MKKPLVLFLEVFFQHLHPFFYFLRIRSRVVSVLLSQVLPCELECSHAQCHLVWQILIEIPIRIHSYIYLFGGLPYQLLLVAINDTISGCGIRAIVQEKEQFGYVRVIFPDVIGIPADFDRIRTIILDIIPCHLEVEFYFRYLTWAECHAHGYTWAIIHEREYTWLGFQMAV